MHLRDGVNTAITWPSIELFSAQDPTGKDVLLLAGHEPDSQWRRFVDVTTALAIGFGTRLMVGLGAYPIGVPHTRPSLLSVSASTSDLVERLGYLHNSLDVPAGVQAAIERAFADRVCRDRLWAQLPLCVGDAVSMARLRSRGLAPWLISRCPQNHCKRPLRRSGSHR